MKVSQVCGCSNYVRILSKVFESYADMGNSIFFYAAHCIKRSNTFGPFFCWIKKIRILPLHSRLLCLAASPWVILDGSASLFPFKHTRPWIFSSAPRQEPVRTSLWGHPGGHWGANQASGQGSLVIIMQGIFSLPSTEERQRDTGHRLLTHSWQLFALCDFKPAALKKKKKKKKLVYKWMPHDSRSRGKWVCKKGNLVILTLTAKAYLKWKCHPFSSHHCWWRFCWHFRIKLSPCRHFTKGKNSTWCQYNRSPRWQCVWTSPKRDVSSRCFCGDIQKVRQFLSSGEVCF